MCALIPLVILVCFWILADFEVRTKLIWTGIYFASWLLLFLDFWAMLWTQMVITLILAAFTFGRRMRSR
jgi:hypothetical protein